LAKDPYQTHSDMSYCAFSNAIVHTGHTTHLDQAVLVEQHRIVGLTNASAVPSHYEVTDLRGLHLAPGLLDLQIYGGGGSMFNTSTSPETISKTVAQHRRTGTTGLQITLSSMPFSHMLEAIDVAKQYQQSGQGGLLGLHLEGPYFSLPKRGAHLAQYIKKATLLEIEALIERSQGLQTYLTFAPEEMDDACLNRLLRSHIQLSAGHSSATYAQAQAAFERGVSRVTHLFNAMTPFQSREPGLVGATYDSQVRASIIADGIHCDFASVRISHQIMGQRLFLITDAVTQDPLGDYAFRLAGDRFTDANGTLAGSALSMIQAVRNCVRHVGIALDEALRMAATYPAEVIGQGHRMGRIRPDYQADMIVFDGYFEVKATVENGQLAWF
jgi:N-acetylglucosamine-6-phosphate deacetylase